MATIYYEKDADPEAIRGQKVAVLGFGSQGHAHALNLKDSGHDVRVGLRPGSASRKVAEDAGLRVLDTADAVREADVVMVVLPDTAQSKAYADDIEPNLEPGNMLMFAHGFNIHFGTIAPPEGVDVTMIAPNLTPGKTLMFAHGFNIHFGFIKAPEGVDVSMVAPKSPGHRVRERVVEALAELEEREIGVGQRRPKQEGASAAGEDPLEVA